MNIKAKLQDSMQAKAESLAPRARELAQEKAEEENVGIDQICVVATPLGLHAHVMDES